jgi:dephospho-CoA kinase
MVVQRAVAARFGSESYLADGSLNRPFLAKTIFSSQRARKALEKIVHPATIAEIHRQIAALDDQMRRPYVVVEAALIYESGFDNDLDHVVVIEADEADRMQRLVHRDGLSREDVFRRFKAQMGPTEKSRKADFVIRNCGTVEDLRMKVKFIDTVLRKMVV